MNAKAIAKLVKKASQGGVLAGSLLAVSMSPSSFAATGTTQVDITFPPLIILYYYDDIDIAVDANDFADMVAFGLTSCSAGVTSGVAEMECSANTSPLALGTASITGTSATYDASIEGDANVSTPVGNTDFTFVIENSWAVRALGTNLAASIVAGGGDFSSPTISPTTPTSSLTLSDGNNVGDVQFDVDLSSLAGLVASDTLTITVNSTP